MEIVKGVHMLDCAPGSHVYLIQGDENILIDTSFPGVGQKMLDEIKSIGVEPKSIRHILLTHHDVDHIGNANFLKDMTGAFLWASSKDIPYIMGEANRPGLKRIIQTIVRLKKPPIDKSYEDDQRFGDIEVINAPGHTPGHVVLTYNKVLFAGDLFKEKEGKLMILPKFMNWNDDTLKKSLRMIKDMEFDWICPSHGSPFKRNAEWKNFISKY